MGAKDNSHGFYGAQGFDLESDSLSITSPYSELGKGRNDSVIGFRTGTESGSESRTDSRTRTETAFREGLVHRVGTGSGTGSGSIILEKGLVGLSEEILEKFKDNVRSRAQIRSVS